MCHGQDAEHVYFIQTARLNRRALCINASGEAVRQF